MAAQPYSATPILIFPNGTTTGLVHYIGATSSTGLMPVLPSPRDTPTAFKFYSNLTSLRTGPFWLPCPNTVDEKMFITISGGLQPCGPVANCSSPLGPRYRLSASMNNVSYLGPSTLSLLEAFYYGVDGIYTDDFPNNPPVVFDYTNPKQSLNFDLLMTERGTRVKRLKYNSVVEIVFQNTALLVAESHPVHLHGFDFYVLAQGFGNYDPINGPTMFNLRNPQQRSTIAVPIGGWAVIRFRANNPGDRGRHKPHNFRVSRGWRDTVEYGLEPHKYAPVVNALQKNPHAWLDFMMKQAFVGQRLHMRLDGGVECYCIVVKLSGMWKNQDQAMKGLKQPCGFTSFSKEVENKVEFEGPKMEELSESKEGVEAPVIAINTAEVIEPVEEVVSVIEEVVHQVTIIRCVDSDIIGSHISLPDGDLCASKVLDMVRRRRHDCKRSSKACYRVPVAKAPTGSWVLIEGVEASIMKTTTPCIMKYTEEVYILRPLLSIMIAVHSAQFWMV
ncbi:hypothetical protein IFM89_013327 [Coptis chinensis]|uniref:Plastocyanin-like domain-containing protein n=1 Tax=Coptis chinensis TaxID=261450 RepID=A0A835HAJ7_9MAGN|nr:hypothetical protein IFM89_013327 [Coptis chinensis]